MILNPVISNYFVRVRSYSGFSLLECLNFYMTFQQIKPRGYTKFDDIGRRFVSGSKVDELIRNHLLCQQPTKKRVRFILLVFDGCELLTLHSDFIISRVR